MNSITILDGFILQEDCDALVKEFNTILNKFNKNIDNRLLYVNSNEPVINYFIKKYINKFNKKLNKTYYIREILLSIYKSKSYLQEHIDWDVLEYKDNLGMLLYLNDDFEGGELYFSKKKLSFKPKKGSVIIFPCNQNEYTHSVNEIKSGVRYTIPLEITLKKEQALGFIHSS